jgi:hypothetical protein
MKRWLLLLLLCAPALRAEERFLIERIDVRHLVHASADVIRQETRLHEGETYAEGELRAASDRVRRLPFVLDASFSLERGSVRDAYVLVITVTETRPLFYQFELVPFFKARNTVEQVDSNLILGGRWFASPHDVFHLAALAQQSERPFESDFLALQAGYTRYGLFHDRAFATVTINRLAPLGPGGDEPMLPGALIGISLTPNQTLTVSYSANETGSRRNRRTQRILEPRLAYNTTNHPYFPTQGSLLSFAPVAVWLDAGTLHELDTAIDGHAAHYWPLNEQWSGAAILDGGFLHVEARSPGHRTFGYGTAALQLARTAGEDRRLELTLRAVSQHHVVVPLQNEVSEASLAWVRRSAWGVLRLGVGYAW